MCNDHECACYDGEAYDKIESLEQRVKELEELNAATFDIRAWKVEQDKLKEQNSKYGEVLWKVRMYLMNGYWQETVSPDEYIRHTLKEERDE